MIQIKFICCLDRNFNEPGKVKRVKPTVQSIVEVTSLEDMQKAIKHEFSMHSDLGWKVEFELLAPLAATYSTPCDSIPMTVHKMSKDGKKVWASYDNYMADDKAETGYRYDNDKADDPDQWTEFQLKTDKKGNSKFVRKGSSSTGWPLLLGFRRRWYNPSL